MDAGTQAQKLKARLLYGSLLFIVCSLLVIAAASAVPSLRMFLLVFSVGSVVCAMMNLLASLTKLRELAKRQADGPAPACPDTHFLNENNKCTVRGDVLTHNSAQYRVVQQDPVSETKLSDLNTDDVRTLCQSYASAPFTALLQLGPDCRQSS